MVDLACLEHINNRKAAERRRCDVCANVTPSGSRSLLREVNGRSKVSEIGFTGNIMV